MTENNSLLFADQAETYDRISSKVSPEKEDGLELMKLLCVERGSKVLDYGCGVGNLTRTLAELVGPQGMVVGVDPDPDRIKMARERYSTANTTYVQGNHENIPGRDYDIVFSNYVIMRCQDKEAVFQKMAQVLKRGGKFGFITGRHYDKLKHLFVPAEAFSQEIIASYGNALYLSTVEEYAALATPNFETLYWKEGNYLLKFASVETLVMFFMANSGINDRRHINEDILKSHYKDGGVLSLPNLTAVLVRK